MNDLHSVLLQKYFFEFIDQGDAAEITPLFTGVYEDQPLADIICEEFAIPLDEANVAIDLARREVAL